MTLSRDEFGHIIATHHGRTTEVCRDEPEKAERCWLDSGCRPAFARAAAYGALADRDATIRVARDVNLITRE